MTTNTRLGIAIVALLFCAGVPGSVRAAEPGSKPSAVPSAEPSAASIKGKVLQIDTDALVLGTDSGGQVRLKVDKDTKFERALKVGDKVEAELGSDRQAINVKLSGAAPGSSEEKGSERK